MAVTVTWSTKIVNINQVDMVLVDSSPLTYQLDLEALRNTLHDLMDDEDGMAFDTIFTHNEGVTVSGAVLARVIQFINGYTVSFEETGTPYRVNAVGANSNIGEVQNLLSGEVSLSTSNSAGLQDLNSLQAASFAGAISVDPSSLFTGTNFPVGTRGFPVQSLSDAAIIASNRGIGTIHIVDTLTIGTGDSVNGLKFIGDNVIVNSVTVNSDSTVTNCIFENLKMDGELDNNNTLKNCHIMDLMHVNGDLINCAIEGTITQDGGSNLLLNNCYSVIAGGGITDTPTIDMGGSGQSLSIRNYSGGIELINKTGTDKASVDISSGQVIIDSTVTAGTITLRGQAKLTDNSGVGATIDSNELINSDNIATAVWEKDLTGSFDAGTAGNTLNSISSRLKAVYNILFLGKRY